MSLLVYNNSFDNVSRRFDNAIAAAVPASQTEMYRDRINFIHRLCRPGRMLDIAVLLVGTRKDLDEILSIQFLLRDLRLIIVLPDSDPNTIYKAHSLRPRFLTFVSHDFEDLGAVLMKMLGLSNSNGKEVGNNGIGILKRKEIIGMKPTTRRVLPIHQRRHMSKQTNYRRKRPCSRI